MALGAILVLVLALVSPGFWMIAFGIVGNFILCIYETLPTWAIVLGYVCLIIAFAANVIVLYFCWDNGKISKTAFWVCSGMLIIAAIMFVIAFIINPVMFRVISAVILLLVTIVSSDIAELWVFDVI